MEHMNLRLNQASATIVAFSRRLVLGAIGLFVTYVALRGISEAWDNEGFPESLAVKLELMPLIFPIHMVTGGLALLLVPLAIFLRGTKIHKWAGRLAAVDIAIAGFTAFPVALDMPITKVSAAGFTVQALTWLTLLGLGIWHIRNGRTRQHRTMMLLVAAVTSGAMFFRIYLGFWKMIMGAKYFYYFYALDAWIAWGLPLLAMAMWLKKSKSNRLA
jgi:Predicted membrane protein (DUF2306)